METVRRRGTQLSLPWEAWPRDGYTDLTPVLRCDLCCPASLEPSICMQLGASGPSSHSESTQWQLAAHTLRVHGHSSGLEGTLHSTNTWLASEAGADLIFTHLGQGDNQAPDTCCLADAALMTHFPKAFHRTLGAFLAGGKWRQWWQEPVDRAWAPPGQIWASPRGAPWLTGRRDQCAVDGPASSSLALPALSVSHPCRLCRKEPSSSQTLTTFRNWGYAGHLGGSVG